MFSESHKSISAVLLCYTLGIVLQNSGGLCQEVFHRKTGPEHIAPKDHVRISRSASPPQDHLPSSMGKEGGEGHLFPPLTLNKYQTRMSRFHGSNPNRFVDGGGHVGGVSLGYGSPVARMLVSRDAPGVDGLFQSDGGESGRQHQQQGFETLGEPDPTFTPFISARALSNMPQFFDYLKANLEALNQNEAETDSDELESGQLDEDFALGFQPNDDSNGGGGVIGMPGMSNYPEHKGLRWLPASFGGGLRARGSNIRHFVQQPSLAESLYRTQSGSGYNPARNVYEFGLG